MIEYHIVDLWNYIFEIYSNKMIGEIKHPYSKWDLILLHLGLNDPELPKRIIFEEGAKQLKLTKISYWNFFHIVLISPNNENIQSK